MINIEPNHQCNNTLCFCVVKVEMNVDVPCMGELGMRMLSLVVNLTMNEY